MIDPKYDVVFTQAMKRLEHVNYLGVLMGQTVQEWRDTEPIQFDITIAPDRLSWAAHVREDVIVPPRVGFLFGDVVHDLRSILNNVISSIGSDAGLTGKALKALQYPIASTAADFANMGNTYAGLPQDVVQTLKDQQGYNRPPAQALPANTLDAMIILHRFSNQDKHHIATTADAGPQQFKWTISTEYEVPPGPNQGEALFGHDMSKGSMLIRVEPTPCRIRAVTATLAFTGTVIAVAGSDLRVEATQFTSAMIPHVEQTVRQLIGGWMLGDNDQSTRDDARKLGPMKLSFQELASPASS
jgi:hypothetical protein